MFGNDWSEQACGVTAGIFDLRNDLNLQSLLIFTGFGKATNFSVKEGMKATEFSLSNPLGIPIFWFCLH